MKAPYPISDVLIVLVKEPNDFYIAQTQHWYRIPTSSRIPGNLRDRQARVIAFYFPSAFKEQKFSIRFYARITSVEVVSRQALFPVETLNSKSGKTYYKICFEPLQTLPRPIISYRGRRLIFVATTWAKFSQAEEINDLFHESPLEDKLWQELKKHKLLAESTLR